jgi:hypothetical protein
MKLSLGWILMALAIASGCGLAMSEPTPIPPTPVPSGLAHFSDYQLSFDYPAAWVVGQYDDTSSFSSLKAFLSTEPLHDPCVRTPSSISCGNPIVQLAPNGILVGWWRRSWPGWTFDPGAGEAVHVAGEPATLEVTQSGETGDMVCDRYMVVKIPDQPANSNWTEMDACLRGPDLAASQAQIEAMLRSVQWENPNP